MADETRVFERELTIDLAQGPQAAGTQMANSCLPMLADCACRFPDGDERTAFWEAVLLTIAGGASQHVGDRTIVAIAASIAEVAATVGTRTQH